MRIKGPWTITLVAAAAVIFAAACVGEAATVAPTTTPLSTPTQSATPIATDATDATVPPAKDTTAPQPTNPATEVSASGRVWEISTVDTQGAKPSVAIAPDGTPHVAFILEAEPGFLKHAVLADGGWTVSTVATGYFYGPLDLAMDDDGKPHISWHNHDTENEGYAVLKDGEWQISDVAHPGHDGWDNNIAVDSTGTPHTVSIDPSQFGSDSGVEYATLSGGAWRVEEVGSGAVPYEFGTDIAMDSQDKPHLVWFDDSSKDLKYAVRTDGSWTISTVDSDGDVGRFPSLAIDGGDLPSISYFERTGNSAGFIKLARRDGTSWDTQRIDELNDTFIDFFGARKTSSLALDPDGNPIVAYSDEAAVKLAQWDGRQWVVETVITAGELPLGQQVSLAVDGQKVLHLVFADVKSKGSLGVTGTVRYAKGAIDPSASTGQKPKSLDQPTTAGSSIQTFDPLPQSSHPVAANFKEYRQLLPQDAIRPIYEPKFVPGQGADLAWEELVIGVEINGESRAYPVGPLNFREMVNDVVGGVPILVTW